MPDTAEQILRKITAVKPHTLELGSLIDIAKEYFKAKDAETKALKVAMRQVFEGIDPGKEQDLYDFLTSDDTDPDIPVSDLLPKIVFIYPLFIDLSVRDAISIVDDNMRLILEEFNNA